MRARTHSNPLNFYQRLEPLALSEVFPNFDGHIDIEIGTGMGLFLRRYAAGFPQRNIIGVEVRKKVADIVAERIQADGVTNVHMVYGTAERLIEDALPDGVIDRVFVFHPDPWFKKRHHNRRLIRPQFLSILVSKLAPGARLYISTDVTILWDAMIATLLAAGWKETQDDVFWNTHYETNWQLYTESDQRSQHFGTFDRI
jgi:tRNA (guanine-N7-)-methyltransferase